MGGNALTQFCTTRRYSAAEYHKLSDEVFSLLTCSNPRISDVHVVRAYRAKESFGDLDILYTTHDDSVLTREDIQSIFPNTKGMFINSNVTSVEHKEFQVDLIHCPTREYQYSCAYFAWNDCGNLVGKIARRFGLKHGHGGLLLPVRSEHTLLRDVVLTRDYQKAFQFLGLDSDKFDHGFETLEDMFQWVMSSPWFDPSAYLLENVSHYGRVRDRKRTTYQTFLKYLDEHPPATVIDLPKDKTIHLGRVFDEFHYAFPEFQQVVTKHSIDLLCREKFGGSLVRELTGLSGKELGAFVAYLRSHLEFAPSVLLMSSSDTITNHIMRLHKVWIETGESQQVP